MAESLKHQSIYVRNFSFKGIAEEAPASYKDIDEVVRSAVDAGLMPPVARVKPLVCIKG
ncbi:MAG: RtcB family protein [Pseudodesulfovibrio sp.]|nr:RtcB family protein [Pseudodesulfovibrio sp.]